MTGFKLNTWTAVAIAAGLQLAVLCYMVWGRVSLLAHGREITVDVVPVDPRDIFRGDYVVLGYDFTRASRENTRLPAGAHYNSPVYLTLSPDGAGWKASEFTRDYPANVTAEQVVLKGRVDQIWPRTTGGDEGRIRFGIESYFVPEGTGREIETAVRDKKVRAVLAIGPDGTAAIKALEVDGKRIHEQPVL